MNEQKSRGTELMARDKDWMHKMQLLSDLIVDKTKERLKEKPSWGVKEVHAVMNEVRVEALFGLLEVILSEEPEKSDDTESKD